MFSGLSFLCPSVRRIEKGQVRIPVPVIERKLKQLEEENSKLKRVIADLSLDKAMLQDVLSKKL